MFCEHIQIAILVTLLPRVDEVLPIVSIIDFLLISYYFPYSLISSTVTPSSRRDLVNLTLIFYVNSVITGNGSNGCNLSLTDHWHRVLFYV